MPNGTIACLLVLAMFMSPTMGCATYRTAHLPGESPQQTEDVRRGQQLFVGATARVVFPDGEKSAGEITAITDSTFTIGRKGNYGLESRTLTRSEITVLEMEDQASFASVAVATLTGIAVVVVSMFVLFITQYESN